MVTNHINYSPVVSFTAKFGGMFKDTLTEYVMELARSTLAAMYSRHEEKRGGRMRCSIQRKTSPEEKNI